jgi:hypothetical protein
MKRMQHQPPISPIDNLMMHLNYFQFIQESMNRFEQKSMKPLTTLFNIKPVHNRPEFNMVAILTDIKANKKGAKETAETLGRKIQNATDKKIELKPNAREVKWLKQHEIGPATDSFIEALNSKDKKGEYLSPNIVPTHRETQPVPNPAFAAGDPSPLWKKHEEIWLNPVEKEAMFTKVLDEPRPMEQPKPMPESLLPEVLNGFLGIGAQYKWKESPQACTLQAKLTDAHLRNFEKTLSEASIPKTTYQFEPLKTKHEEENKYKLKITDPRQFMEAVRACLETQCRPGAAAMGRT